MTSSVLQPPAWLPVQEICLFWHKGLFHMEGQELAVTPSQGVPSTSVLLPLLVEFWVHPGCGLGRGGRHALEQSSQLSLGGLSAGVGLLP